MLAACGYRGEPDTNAAQLLKERKKGSPGKLPGVNQPVSEDLIRKGEVLIAYSDCAICHREDAKVRGPAFQDIAARYPRNEEYRSEEHTSELQSLMRSSYAAFC